MAYYNYRNFFRIMCSCSIALANYNYCTRVHVDSVKCGHCYIYVVVHKRMYEIQMNLQMLQPLNVFVTLECLYYICNVTV